MKILEEGKVPKFISKCWYCGTKFEYQLSDVHHSLNFYYGKEWLTIKCPLCLLDYGYIEGDNITEQIRAKK